jgi:hypothetical protein
VVVVTVVAPPASMIVVMARAVVVVVVDALGPSSGLDSVLHVTIGPEAAPPPSPRSRCWEGGGFGLCADGAPARPLSEHWREAQHSACCAAVSSSNAFN